MIRLSRMTDAEIQTLAEDAEAVIAALAAQVQRLERTVGWLLLAAFVPMVLLGLVVGLTLIR